MSMHVVYVASVGLIEWIELVVDLSIYVKRKKNKRVKYVINEKFK